MSKKDLLMLKYEKQFLLSLPLGKYNKTTRIAYVGIRFPGKP